MEEYRKALKKRVVLWLLVIIISAAGLGLFFVCGGVLFGMDVELRRSFGGMFGCLFLFSAESLVCDRSLLVNEKKLKEKYIRNNDERNISIDAKSARMTLNIVMVALFVAFLLVSLFSGKDAGGILGICFYGTWLTRAVVKSYYDKKM